MTHLQKTILRVALGALALTMVPLVASQFVEDWNWNAGTFILVFTLLFIAGMAYAAISARRGAWSYKAGVGVSLAAGLALAWSNWVHMADSENPANAVYFAVLALGVAGASLARLQPRGLAYTLFAMAVVLGAVALVLPSGAPPLLARNMAVSHGVLVAIFMGAALLFRHARLARD